MSGGRADGLETLGMPSHSTLQSVLFALLARKLPILEILVSTRRFLRAFTGSLKNTTTRKT
jgi:hypothetical protein